ncbi:MAG: rRNA maturation RNase YbeY [Syntrophothermus sp.]
MIKNVTISAEKGIKANKPLIHRVIGLLREKLGFTIESLTIDFLDSASIKEVNIKYLGHNYSTDIITFNYSGSVEELDGEIIISAGDALTNSKKYKCTLDSEILRLIIHGILHMIGFDDQDKSSRAIMKKHENKLTKELDHLLIEKILIYDGKNS